MRLYHGTTARRFGLIMHSGAIIPSFTGNRHVSLTTCFDVASYIASSTAGCTDYFEGLPLVLTIEADMNSKQFFAFSDPVWGEGECAWEKEIGSRCPIRANKIIEVTSNVSSVSRDELVNRKG